VPAIRVTPGATSRHRPAKADEAPSPKAEKTERGCTAQAQPRPQKASEQITMPLSKKADRERARARRIAAKAATAIDQSQDEAELARLSAFPLVLRDPSGIPEGLTEHGLMALDLLARKHKQNYAARYLKITRSQMKTLMEENKSNNAVRLAWESGNALHEERHLRRTDAWADKSFVTNIHYGKTVFGWKESEAPLVNIDQRGPGMVLPDALSEAELYKRLGISGPVHLVAQPAPIKQIEGPRAAAPLSVIQERVRALTGAPKRTTLPPV
jgi:hypothetical protein